MPNNYRAVSLSEGTRKQRKRLKKGLRAAKGGSLLCDIVGQSEQVVLRGAKGPVIARVIEVGPDLCRVETRRGRTNVVSSFTPARPLTE